MNENERGHAFLPKNNLVTVEEVVRQNNRPASAPMRYAANSSNNAFASFRSSVSKPSVNQP
jgi:hypothetical protein